MRVWPSQRQGDGAGDLLCAGTDRDRAGVPASSQPGRVNADLDDAVAAAAGCGEGKPIGISGGVPGERA